MQLDIAVPSVIDNANRNEGGIPQATHDAIVAALRTEVQSVRDNEDHLLQCGRAWKKERDELRKRVAELETTIARK